MVVFQDHYKKYNKENKLLATFKSVVDYLSSPTISFTILTVLTPLVFPPTDWFDKINRKLKINLLWTKTGCAIGMILITLFFIIGVLDKNFSIILLKADNFPIVLMVYSMFLHMAWNAQGLHQRRKVRKRSQA